MSSNGFDYRQSGVDIDAAEKAVQEIRQMVAGTFRPEVLTEIGGFTGLFAPRLGSFREPVLAAATDGVGTKLKIAFLTGRHDTVGIDLVAMCVNDLMVQGAEPLFFLDYLATGKLHTATFKEVVGGIAEGCRQAGCALLGGETAEMPGFYGPGEYDLAGFAVGIVEKEKIITGEHIAPGDVLIGMASTGLHSNGFSLARKIFFEHLAWRPEKYVPELGATLGEELLKPTAIYVPPLLSLLREHEIKGISHITGGGLAQNLPRILPPNARAVIEKKSWQVPPIFPLIAERGRVEEKEMFRTFNMGVGMVLVVPPEEAAVVRSHLEKSGWKAWEIGEVERREREQAAGVEIR